MKEKELKRKFICKYVLVYFLYGHLSFIGFALSTICGIFIFTSSKFPVCLLAALPLFAAFACITKYARILSTTKFKWKFYKVFAYRIERKPFDEDWFCNYMNEPCMRLIIKDLCYEHGYIDEYKNLYDRFAHENHYIEMKKKEIIEQTKRERRTFVS